MRHLRTAIMMSCVFLNASVAQPPAATGRIDGHVVDPKGLALEWRMFLSVATCRLKKAWS